MQKVPPRTPPQKTLYRISSKETQKFGLTYQKQKYKNGTDRLLFVCAVGLFDVAKKVSVVKPQAYLAVVELNCSDPTYFIH